MEVVAAGQEVAQPGVHGAGQLEREIRENVWLTVDADEALVFDDDYDTKWSRALGKLGVDRGFLREALRRDHLFPRHCGLRGRQLVLCRAQRLRGVLVGASLLGLSVPPLCSLRTLKPANSSMIPNATA